MFVGSIFAHMITMFLKSLIWEIFLLNALSNMHNAMAERVMRATILFFDSNPSGRVVTRFSKD